MREVAVVSFAQSKAVRSAEQRNEVELLMPVVQEAVAKSGIGRKEIGFTVSGSCDYLAGVPFAFVQGLDAVGAWPPIRESHVEMDAAWALYEAWVRLQHGDLDSALVYGFGKSSLGDLPDVLVLQLDPYHIAPLWPDSISVAALQARAWLDAGHDEAEMADVAARSRRDAKANPFAQLSGASDPAALLAQPYIPPRCGATIVRRSPTERPPSSWRRATWPAGSARGRRGSAASTTVSSPTPSVYEI
jgi:acetyl-CoA acetyltransferase